MTLDQLRVRLETALGQYQKNVKLIITPVGINSKNFAIIGRVRKPGSYTSDRPTSILEGIALAQGIQIGSVGGSAFGLADLERSFVARNGRKLSVDLAKLYYEGDFSQNAFLEPSDYIDVASKLDNEVYVLGFVVSPGRRKMPSELTITKAVGEAGGAQMTPIGFTFCLFGEAFILRRPEWLTLRPSLLAKNRMLTCVVGISFL